MICEDCKREVPSQEIVCGSCATCRDPEVLLEHVSRLPAPLRDVLLKVGNDFGVFGDLGI